MAGICNTDLELAQGYMGFNGVLGHEFVGEALDGPLAGRRVVGEINFGCGHCEVCRRDMARHCPKRSVLGILGADGVMSDSFLIPTTNLLEVGDGVDDTTAVFTEPVAAACEILEQLGPDFPRSDALVLGAGKLGTLIAQVLAAEGFAVSLYGRHLESVSWLLGRGIRLMESLGDESLAKFPLVVEATGSAEGLEYAIGCTEPRGSLVLKTTIAGRHEIDFAPVVINEIRLLGSRCGRFAPALKLLSQREIEVEPLVEEQYRLAEAERAFERASTRGTRKILLVNT